MGYATVTGVPTQSTSRFEHIRLCSRIDALRIADEHITESSPYYAHARVRTRRNLLMAGLSFKYYESSFINLKERWTILPEPEPVADRQKADGVVS